MAKLAYRELKKELDQVIDQLSAADIDIEDAILLQKKATDLIKQLKAYLEKLEKKDDNINSSS